VPSANRLHSANHEKIQRHSKWVFFDFGLWVKALDTIQSFFMLIRKSGRRPLRLIDMISVRDLRRLFERDGPRVHNRIADEIMNLCGALATTALVLMEERKIPSLIFTGVDGLALGVAHLYDLWILELI
jgi:hypothetical protein